MKASGLHKGEGDVRVVTIAWHRYDRKYKPSITMRFTEVI
jgi:hypothetical protein